MPDTRISRRTILAAAGAAAGMMVLPQQPSDAAEDPWKPVPAWDIHTHLAGVSGTAPQRVARLLEYADRVGVDRIVLMMGLNFIPCPTPEQIRQQNDEVLQAIASCPKRVLGFAYLNPRYPQESLAELDRVVRNGPMVGIKLWIAQECSHANLDPIAKRAIELKIPILQHTYFRLGGNLPGESSPTDVAVLAARHPELALICAHAGNDWEQGIRAIRAAKNVSIDISGSDPTAGMVEMAVRELGPERVLFGSDAGGRSFASQLAKVYSADIPASSKRLILRDNTQRMLAPAMERAAKGGAS